MDFAVVDHKCLWSPAAFCVSYSRYFQLQESSPHCPGQRCPFLSLCLVCAADVMLTVHLLLFFFFLLTFYSLFFLFLFFFFVFFLFFFVFFFFFSGSVLSSSNCPSDCFNDRWGIPVQTVILKLSCIYPSISNSCCNMISLGTIRLTCSCITFHVMMRKSPSLIMSLTARCTSLCMTKAEYVSAGINLYSLTISNRGRSSLRSILGTTIRKEGVLDCDAIGKSMSLCVSLMLMNLVCDLVCGILEECPLLWENAPKYVSIMVDITFRSIEQQHRIRSRLIVKGSTLLIVYN